MSNLNTVTYFTSSFLSATNHTKTINNTQFFPILQQSRASLSGHLSSRVTLQVGGHVRHFPIIITLYMELYCLIEINHLGS